MVGVVIDLISDFSRVKSSATDIRSYYVKVTEESKDESTSVFPHSHQIVLVYLHDDNPHWDLRLGAILNARDHPV